MQWNHVLEYKQLVFLNKSFFFCTLVQSVPCLHMNYYITYLNLIRKWSSWSSRKTWFSFFFLILLKRVTGTELHCHWDSFDFFLYCGSVQFFSRFKREFVLIQQICMPKSDYAIFFVRLYVREVVDDIEIHFRWIDFICMKFWTGNFCIFIKLVIFPYINEGFVVIFFWVVIEYNIFLCIWMLIISMHILKP